MKKVRRQPKGLYHINNWPLHFALGLVRVIAYLPKCGKRKLINLVSWGLFTFSSRMRKVAQINIQTCFPELSAAEQTALLRENLRLLTTMLIEGLNMAWPSSTNILPTLGTVTGLEHIEAALNKKQGVLLLFTHQIAVYVVGYLLRQQLQLPFSAMYHQPRNLVLRQLFETHLPKHCEAVFNRSNTKEMINYLREGKLAWYAPDLEPSKKRAVYAPLFGQQAATYGSTARIAHASGAACIFISFYRRENEAVYDVIFHPPLTQFPTDNEINDATTINQQVEAIIRKAPAQYLWIYKRFSSLKDKPEGLYKGKI
jgi:KDO2-lipid IV(A) lauroyltransferase